jgi:preprotein translocase subunit SecE
VAGIISYSSVAYVCIGSSIFLYNSDTLIISLIRV